MGLSVKGTVKEVLKVKKGVSKDKKKWQTQDFIIDTGAQYKPEICFQVFGKDKIEKIFEDVDEGTEVEVHFNLSSREFEGNYYHNVNAWKVDVIED